MKWDGQNPTNKEGWLVAKCRCDVCGHESVDVFPVEADPAELGTGLECSGCGGMCSFPYEYIPPEMSNEEINVMRGDKELNLHRWPKNVDEFIEGLSKN